MKILILNGSPHKEGDTAALLAAFKEAFSGEVLQIDAFKAKIACCTDCRYCRTHTGCCIQDAMQPVYEAIESCDRILIASPVWFETLTPPLMAMVSRLQPYFSARFFRGEQPNIKPKKGGVLLVGGGSGGTEKAYDTACMILKQMNTKEIAPLLCSPKTDRLPAKEDSKALQAARQLANWFCK